MIVLDIGVPTLNGIEAADRISKLVPDADILFVTEHSDADVVAAALSNGAKGYVLKVNAKRELLPAVEAVLEGLHFVGLGVTHLRSASPPQQQGGKDLRHGAAVDDNIPAKRLYFEILDRERDAARP